MVTRAIQQHMIRPEYPMIHWHTISRQFPGYPELGAPGSSEPKDSEIAAKARGAIDQTNLHKQTHKLQ